MAEGLKRCPMLETLDLSGHRLGPHGGKAIADALVESGCPLKRLRLASLLGLGMLQQLQ
jgi:hypothetical protein